MFNQMRKAFLHVATVSLGLLLYGFTQAADESPIQPIAHRGLLLHSPENTLANFAACQHLRLGFEFDVRRTKDGALVSLHDDTLDRTTNGKGAVTEKTFAELSPLDAGSWFSPAFRGEKIPTIDQVFRVIAAYPNQAGLFTADMKGEDEKIEHDMVPSRKNTKSCTRSSSSAGPSIIRKFALGCARRIPNAMSRRSRKHARTSTGPFSTAIPIGFTSASFPPPMMSRKSARPASKRSSPA